MSAQDAVHPWFKSTTETTLTSHNGWSVRRRIEEGTLEAFLEARRHGYRWMQIDAIPIRGELISGHVLFGLLRPKLRNKTLAELRSKGKAVASLREILKHDELRDVHWNIELKSKHGVLYLLDLLEELAETRDLRTIMISSPLRRSTLRVVAERFPTVALAAPVLHGGFHGLWNRPVARDRPYDCQQCWHGFSYLKPAARNGRTLRQFWTICGRRSLHRGAEKGRANMIVDSARLNLPHQRDTARMICTPLGSKNPRVLALGGGGFRGGFGGIGTVLYFAYRGLWPDIRQVVGISGGAFVVAALSAAPDDDDPIPVMAQFCKRLDRAGRIVGNIVLLGLALAAPVVAVVIFALVNASSSDSWWTAPLIVVGVVLMTSVLARSYITIYWRVVLNRLYRKQTMLQRDKSARRYRIGATGMHDGNLYAFSSCVAADRDRWLENTNRSKELPIPVPLARDRNGNQRPRELCHAVLRATSLPGVGPFGRRRICLLDHASKGEHDDQCRVPDRLVDGGISGIFGRGLIDDFDASERVLTAPADETPVPFRAPADSPELVPSGAHQGHVSTAEIDLPFLLQPEDQAAAIRLDAGDSPLLVVVDAGRALQIRTRKLRDRVIVRGEGVSTIVMLARWLTVSLDVAYRGELKRVEDGQCYDGHRCRLVRLAEEEQKDLGDIDALSAERQIQLDRLSMLRDRIRGFSLLKVSRNWANRSVTVAIAACALEFNEEADVEQILDDIGARLMNDGKNGQVGDLASVWKKIPVLGLPKPITEAC
jgi:hypothetical protein